MDRIQNFCDTVMIEAMEGPLEAWNKTMLKIGSKSNSARKKIKKKIDQKKAEKEAEKGEETLE